MTYVVGAWNVLCRYSEVIFSHVEKEATEERNYVGAIGTAGDQASNNCLVVAEQADAEGALPLIPDCYCKHIWVKLFPLDTLLQLGCCPAPIEPLTLAVSPKANSH